MKLLIASDIHGSAHWCEQLVKAYKNEGASRLVLLGDILYHGPRNPFPNDYSPQKVLTALNALKEEITCIRGNCDSEVDQMVLEFPILADYALIDDNSRTLFLTHGHIYNDKTPPLLKKGDVLFNGHFHTPCKRTMESGAIYANCGSTALPKDDTPHSYIVYEDGALLWKSLESGEVFDELHLA